MSSSRFEDIGWWPACISRASKADINPYNRNLSGPETAQDFAPYWNYAGSTYDLRGQKQCETALDLYKDGANVPKPQPLRRSQRSPIWIGNRGQAVPPRSQLPYKPISFPPVEVEQRPIVPRLDLSQVQRVEEENPSLSPYLPLSPLFSSSPPVSPRPSSPKPRPTVPRLDLSQIQRTQSVKRPISHPFSPPLSPRLIRKSALSPQPVPFTSLSEPVRRVRAGSVSASSSNRSQLSPLSRSRSFDESKFIQSKFPQLVSRTSPLSTRRVISQVLPQKFNLPLKSTRALVPHAPQPVRLQPRISEYFSKTGEFRPEFLSCERRLQEQDQIIQMLTDELLSQDQMLEGQSERRRFLSDLYHRQRRGTPLLELPTSPRIQELE